MGFFIGKNAYITNLAAFTQFVRKKLQNDKTTVPDFQISIDGVGDTKDATQSKALVVICAAEDISNLRDNLLHHFSLPSAFPFMPFKAMHLLSSESQKAYYHRQRQDTHGADLVEVPIPNFDALDTPSMHPTSMSLREYAFNISSEAFPIQPTLIMAQRLKKPFFALLELLKTLQRKRLHLGYTNTCEVPFYDRQIVNVAPRPSI